VPRDSPRSDDLASHEDVNAARWGYKRSVGVLADLVSSTIDDIGATDRNLAESRGAFSI
jgi:hypothetical protein